MSSVSDWFYLGEIEQIIRSNLTEEILGNCLLGALFGAYGLLFCFVLPAFRFCRTAKAGVYLSASVAGQETADCLTGWVFVTILALVILLSVAPSLASCW